MRLKYCTLPNFMIAALVVANAGMGYRFWTRAPEPVVSDTILNGVLTLAPESRQAFERQAFGFVLVTFLDAGRSAQRAETASLVRPYLTRRLTWHVVSPPGEQAPSRPDGAVAIPVNAGRLEAAFGVRADWDAWYLFSADGRALAQGYLTTGGLAAALHEAFDGALPLSPAVVERELRQASDAGAFAREKAEVRRTPKLTHVALFVNRASTSCQIAHTLLAAQRLATRRPNVHLSVLVPPRWADSDRVALGSTFGLDVPVVPADEQAAASWARLGSEYGHEKLNGMLVTFDESGAPHVTLDATTVTSLLRKMDQ